MYRHLFIIMALITAVFSLFKFSHAEFIDNGNDTVTDMVTGLVWQKSDNHNEAMRTWGSALDYCESLTLADHQWRLPNARELESITDVDLRMPSIDTDYFPNCKNLPYWSSSTKTDEPGKAWCAGFSDGWVGGSVKADPVGCVRCVRGGNSVKQVKTPMPWMLPLLLGNGE